MIFWSWNLFLAFFVSVVFAGVLVPVMLHSVLSGNSFGSSAVSYIYRRAASRCGGISSVFFPYVSFCSAVPIRGAAGCSGVHVFRACRGSFSFVAGCCALGHEACGDVCIVNKKQL